MKQQKIDKQHIEFLKRFNVVDIDLKKARVCIYKPGERIISEQQPLTSIMFVLSGNAKICLSSENGEDVIISYCSSEEIIGDLELMSESYIATSSMIAETEFCCIDLPFEYYSAVLKNDIRFLNHVGKGLANKLLRSSNNGALRTLYSGEQRLCAYILYSAKQDFFCETLTNTAKAIGSSYRNTLRNLKKLLVVGALEKKKNGYYIKDRKLLESKSPATIFKF